MTASACAKFSVSPQARANDLANRSSGHATTATDVQRVQLVASAGNLTPSHPDGHINGDYGSVALGMTRQLRKRQPRALWPETPEDSILRTQY